MVNVQLGSQLLSSHRRGMKYRTMVTINITTKANQDRKGTLKLKTFLMLSRT